MNGDLIDQLKMLSKLRGLMIIPLLHVRSPDMGAKGLSHHKSGVRQQLVIKGKASLWLPYRSVDDAFKAAGLDDKTLLMK